MRKKPSAIIIEKINNLFKLAEEESKKRPEIAKKYIKQARKTAKRANLSLRKYRRLFCHKCNSYFTSENSHVRIKKGTKSVKCLECGSYQRHPIKK